MAPVKRAFPVVGVLLLAVAVWNMVRGEHWVTWAILGALFGGFAVLRRGDAGDGR